MALWGGSTYATTIPVKAFNKLVTAKALDTLRKRQGLLFAVLGKMNVDGFYDPATPGIPSFERLATAEGYQYEVQHLGQYDAPTAKTDGAQEIASATLVNSSTLDANWGSSTFYLTHLTADYAVPNSWLDKASGSSLKGASMANELSQYVIGSWDQTLGTALNSANAQVAASVGGWQWAIDDAGNASAPGGGVGTAGYSAYGGTTRATAENSNMCPYMAASVGDLTIPVIQRTVNECRKLGGNPRISVLNTALYTKVQQLAQAYVQTTDGQWAKFGGDYVQIGPIKFILDANAPTTVVPFIDPDSWVFVMKDKGLDAKLMDAPWLEAASVIKTEAWVGFICKQVRHNAKLTGVTS
jgi:hypothetical protein